MDEVFSKTAFRDLSVLITGGTSGIGAAAGQVFADGGGRVMLTGRNTERGEAECEKIRKTGGTAEFIPGDVTDSAFSERAVAETVKKFGRLDVLFANAGIYTGKSLVETTDEDWQEIFDINVNGTFYFGRAAARQMIAQGEGGSIVNMSSESGLVSYPSTVPYSSTKGAIVHLTKLMASDLARHHIRVNVVCPCDVDTPMHSELWTTMTDLSEPEWRKAAADLIPLGRVCTSEEVAQTVAFLASKAADNITGAVLAIDGGTTTVSGWVGGEQ